ncbi:class I SAM-dependent methyltransferase [Streptomyces sp. YIM 98790]|uniref:class I SAM-dependent methyltransferase n=1 Tax=Streptomyces sp. YIM 98790 TaxID=2689077 RepID=UPI00140E4858|nr:class I SAM-dependent methyltransferase [Streptomyces sp. YIM 98790]
MTTDTTPAPGTGTGTGTGTGEELAERLLAGTTAATEILAVHLGLALGLYRALRDGGPATGAELADRARVAPRYAREWLEQQAVTGYLECLNTTDPAPERRYALPAGHAEALLDPDSPAYTGPLANMLAGIARVMDRLVTAYRTGDGVPFSAYGKEVRHGVAALNGPQFRLALAQEWLPAVPGLERRLRTTPDARVLDLGCGLGASAIALATAFPRLAVDGIDLDEASVAEARAAAATAGVADRVTFAALDARRLPAGGPRYDLVTLFEALHDMADPVAVLRGVRRVLAEDGHVLIADERSADVFTAPGDGLERFLYGCSILHCLPATLAEDGEEAVGTVLRAPRLEGMAREAGFTGVTVLPVENPFWRFYHLRP